MRGQRIRAAVNLGDGEERTPLLLMNGIGARLELLQPFVDRLDPQLDVIRFDVPGVGGSPTPLLPYRLWGLARTVSALLDELGFHGQVDVLGISWGGALAQQFAFTQRSRVRRLVLVATATGAIMVPASPRVLRHMVTHRRYDDPEYLDAIAGEIYGGSARQVDSKVGSTMRTHRDTHDARGYFYQLGAGIGWTSLPFLPLLRTPTLVLAGDDDPLIPVANGKILNRLIPHSTLHIYQGGHLGLVTEADEVVPVIEEFLTAPA